MPQTSSKKDDIRDFLIAIVTIYVHVAQAGAADEGISVLALGWLSWLFKIWFAAKTNMDSYVAW